MQRCLAVLLALVAFSGCGEPPRAKGPALPYTPEQAKGEVQEKDIPLKDDLPRVALKTSLGDLELVLFEDEAPNTVANFVKLVEEKFYDGLAFHRVEPNFCIQGGDPKGDGKGGPGFRIKPEFHDVFHRNVYGTLAMAKQGGQTEQSGSQFYININKNDKGNEHLDRQHVVFGKVVKGMDVVEKMAAMPCKDNKPVEPLKLLSVTLLKKRDHPYTPQRIPAPEEKEAQKTGAAGAQGGNKPPEILKTMPPKFAILPEDKTGTGKQEPGKTESVAKTGEAKSIDAKTGSKTEEQKSGEPVKTGQ